MKRTYISKKLPNERSIFETVLISKLEQIYFCKNQESLDKMRNKINNPAFLNLLGEFQFPDISFKKNKIKDSIRSFFTKFDFSFGNKEFYDMLMGSILNIDEIFKYMCRLIIVNQLILLSETFEVQVLLNKIFKTSDFSGNPELMMIFLNFIESNLIIFNDKGVILADYSNNMSYDTVYLLSYSTSNFEILHKTSILLPLEFYEEKSEFNNILKKEDLRKKEENEVGGSRLNKPNNNSQEIFFYNRLISTFKLMSTELELDSKRTTMEMTTNFNDLIKCIQESSLTLPIEKKDLTNGLETLMESIEKIRTHVSVQPNVKDFCDICDKQKTNYIALDCTRNYSTDKLRVHCENCFEIMIKWGLYTSLDKPNLTIDCFERENCNRRMVFSEKSLKPYIHDESDFKQFIKTLNQLMNNYKHCYSCDEKQTFEGQEDKLIVTCNSKKCNKKTCTVCWKEAHGDILCTHLRIEYENIFREKLNKLLFVCRLCYSLSKIQTHDEIAEKCKNCKVKLCYQCDKKKEKQKNCKICKVELCENCLLYQNEIKCEHCHRNLCRYCFQSIDSINYHGNKLHDISCEKYRISDSGYKNQEEECLICELRGSECKPFEYRKFVGYERF